MICPECNLKMVDASYMYPNFEKYKTGNWTEQDLIYREDRHICLKCGINYAHGIWILPPDLVISEKQNKAIWICYDMLELSEDIRPITSTQAKKFLNKYLPLAQEARANGFIGHRALELEREREQARQEYLTSLET